MEGVFLAPFVEGRRLILAFQRLLPSRALIALSQDEGNLRLRKHGTFHDLSSSNSRIEHVAKLDLSDKGGSNKPEAGHHVTSPAPRSGFGRSYSASVNLRGRRALPRR